MALRLPISEKQASEPLLLGIETSGLTCGVGLAREDRLLGEISINLRNIHSEKLALLFEYLLNTLALTPAQLKAIVLSAGPGSFTGLRIGYSFAKGLACSLNIPLIEVPTLDIWAWQAGPQPRQVLPVIDAHRGELFCSVYRWEAQELIREKEYTLLAPPALKCYLPHPVTLLGADAVRLYPQMAAYLPGTSECLLPSANFLQMWSLCSLGFKKFIQNQLADLDNCEPLYLRAFEGHS